MQVLTYSVRIEPAENDGCAHYVPAPLGHVTQRDTCEAAVAMAH